MTQKKQTLLASILLALMFFSASSFAFADFDPNKLIDDKQFTDTQTFGSAAGIQQFLQTKGSVLANTNTDFLLKLREPQSSSVKSGLTDPEPNLGRLRSAAELIWDSSLKTGLNPQVILVTLQKEQSLITGTFTDTSLQKALDHALGFNCTDSAGCDQTFAGFYFQLFGNFDAQGNKYIGAPASLMRSFNTTGGRGPGVDANNQTFGSPIIRTSRVGDTITLDNTQGPPNNAPATQTITLSNLGTAALYRYTPHVYNGNYNFWKFFSQWFKYPNGTLIKVSGDNNVYIVSNGALSLLLNFVMQSRGLNPATLIATTISPTEFSDYDKGPVFPPSDNTIIQTPPSGAPGQGVSSTYYVFENGVKHQASAFVLKQRNLDTNNALQATQAEADQFTTGSLLPPTDGTLITGDTSKTVYVIQNGKKMVLTGFTFKQYGYSFKKVVVLPQAEVDSYDSNGFLLPKNGTLAKLSGSQEVYLLQDQLIHPISATVFNLFHYSFKNVVQFSANELANANLGYFVAPPDGTYFYVAEIGNYYLYKNGTKHSISAYVLKQRKVASVAVTLGLEEALDLSDGPPLTPKDGTLIIGDQSGTIFAIVKGQKIALDYNTWVKKYKKQKPVVLPQAEVDSYQSPSEVQQ